MEVNKYCLTNPLFQSMITISVLFLFLYGIQPYLIHSTAFADLEISNAKLNKKMEEAVEQTIRECMEEDVMADFLKRNRVEVVKMCLYEYDEEKQREFDREEGREEERQNTLREKARADEEKARADEAFRKIAMLEKQLAELMK